MTHGSPQSNNRILKILRALFLSRRPRESLSLKSFVMVPSVKWGEPQEVQKRPTLFLKGTLPAGTERVRSNTKMKRYLLTPKIQLMDAIYENYAINRWCLSCKRKDDSEGPEGRTKSHGWLSPSLSPNHFQHLPSWIAELLWTNDSFALAFLPFLSRNIYSGSSMCTTIAHWVCMRQITCLFSSWVFRSRGTVPEELHPWELL